MAKKETTTNVTTTISVQDFYPKHEVVTAIRWATGMSKKVAESVYADTCPQFHNLTAMEYRVYGTRRSVRA